MWRPEGIAVVLLAACSPEMEDQPRPRPLGESAFFEDRRASRPLVDGVVARGRLRGDSALHAGREGTEFVAEFPFPIDRAALARGRRGYDAFCSPCHDGVGNGDGPVVRRGFRRPASLHADRLREARPGYLFDVVTNGFGAMPAYAAPVAVEERWEIVAYVRALQLSQRASAADLPPEERRKAEGR